MDNSPHFFKIILGDNIREGRLEIPRKFVRKYGNGLSSPVMLQVPSGETWQVELLKCDGEIWFEKGWQEFAEYQSLDHGHLLVFSYEEHCHFNVIIFDKSASEIEYQYPCQNICVVDQNNQDGEMQELNQLEKNEDSISVEILDDLSPDKDGKEIISLPCSATSKRMRTSPENETMNILALQTLPAQVSNHVTPSSCTMVRGSHCSDREFGESVKQLTWKKNTHKRAINPLSSSTSQALEAANKFISKYPFFKSVVHVDCQRRLNVSIPTRFSRTHFQLGSSILTLRFADRFWSVKVINYQKLAKFCAGWAAFTKANSLKAGDVCILELIETRVLNVSIFKCVN